MSQTESNTTPISQTQTDESQSTSHTRIKVDFTEHGQAIGQNAAKYSTRLGKLTRTHCPPIYEDWHAQDLNSNKIDLWKGIQAEFLVPEEHKKVQLVHANKLWKNWKNNLRKHYDKYSTIAERKRNWPEKMGVKKEDWYVFVDMESTEEARMRREKGKATRKEMNNPHTTGRRGAARTAEILVANNPNEPGTRTDFFMATHTRPDGSFLNEEIGEKMLIIKDILARDPSSKHKDLNHDPVAEVFGKDGRGTVKGYGHGVSKTTLMAAAPYKKKAQEEYMSRLELQRKMDNMERQMDEDRRERREMQEQLNALLTMPGSSQGSHRQFSASQVVFHEASINPLPRQSTIPIKQACELLSIGGRIVAYGTIANIEGPTYKIVIDEVKDWSAELFGVRGKTFGDIDVGHTVQWPTVLTRQPV